MQLVLGAMMAVDPHAAIAMNTQKKALVVVFSKTFSKPPRQATAEALRTIRKAMLANIRPNASGEFFALKAEDKTLNTTLCTLVDVMATSAAAPETGPEEFYAHELDHDRLDNDLPRFPVVHYFKLPKGVVLTDTAGNRHTGIVDETLIKHYASMLIPEESYSFSPEILMEHTKETLFDHVVFDGNVLATLQKELGVLPERSRAH